MSQVKLPTITLEHTVLNRKKKNYKWDNSQINTSALMNYLGVRGIAGALIADADNEKVITRDFNAIPVLAYYDIYKNYYANKQEEIGKIIKAETETRRAQLWTYRTWEPDESTQHFNQNNYQYVNMLLYTKNFKAIGNHLS